MMFSVQVVVLLATLAVTYGRDHRITLFHDIHNAGKYVTVTRGGAAAWNFCDTVGDDWKRKASSINTWENCYDLYSGVGCTGDTISLYPGSPSHDNLEALGFNDRLQSFRLCNLDEQSERDYSCAAGKLCRRNLREGQVEREFWTYFFRNFNNMAYLGEYNARLRARPNGFINWDFLPGIGGLGLSDPQSYSAALDFLMSTLDRADIGNLPMLVLNGLRFYAVEVLDGRHEANVFHGTSSRSGRNHKYIELMWRLLIGVLDDAIRRRRDETFNNSII